MSDAIIVRRAVAADLPAMCQLAAELVHEHGSYDPRRYQPPKVVQTAYADLFAEHVAQPKSFLADRTGELVEYVFGVVEPPRLTPMAITVVIAPS